MPATPADIAKYTNDGVVVFVQAPSVRTMFPDAADTGDGEIEMFYDTQADAQAMLNEKFAILSQIAPPHEAIEIEESLGLGHTVAIAPVIPSFRCVDQTRGMDMSLRCLAYAYEMNSDRYSVEVMK